MCVILSSPSGKRIPEDWIVAAWNANDHGGGLAYRYGDEAVWKKGIPTVEEMIAAYAEVPEGSSHVLHFRIASCGGKAPEMTHPFPLTDDATLALEGRTRGLMLFHNGHYAGYEMLLRETSQRSGGTIPFLPGPWSDTRAMAYIAHKLGLGWLEHFGEKFVLFGPSTHHTYGKGYNSWDLKDGIYCSNLGWTYKLKSHYSSSDRNRSEKEEHTGLVIRGNMPSGKTASSHKGIAEVGPDQGPFRTATQEMAAGPLADRIEAAKKTVSIVLSTSLSALIAEDGSIKYPNGLGKKARKRWRKRMQKEGHLPNGSVRHQLRKAQQLIRMRCVN